MEDLGTFEVQIFMWLVVKNWCCTADRLAKKGLPYPAACPLCDQAEETIQHTLVGCVFAREVWTSLLNSLGLLALDPRPGCAVLLAGVYSFQGYSKGVEKRPQFSHNFGCLGDLEAPECLRGLAWSASSFCGGVCSCGELGPNLPCIQR